MVIRLLSYWSLLRFDDYHLRILRGRPDMIAGNGAVTHFVARYHIQIEHHRIARDSFNGCCNNMPRPFAVLTTMDGAEIYAASEFEARRGLKGCWDYARIRPRLNRPCR